MKLLQARLRDLISARFIRRRAKNLLKKDFIFYLNSSRAVPVSGIFALRRQAAGSSNFKKHLTYHCVEIYS